MGRQIQGIVKHLIFLFVSVLAVFSFAEPVFAVIQPTITAETASATKNTSTTSTSTAAPILAVKPPKPSRPNNPPVTAVPESPDGAPDGADEADGADGAAETEPEEQPTCYDQVGGLGWLICPGTSFLANLIDGAYGIIENLVSVDPIPDDRNSPIFIVWNYLRELANFLFIIAFLLIIYSQLTGLGINNYGIKRMLPRLIISAVLVNASYIVCTIVVDLSNIVGYSFRSLFTHIAQTALTNGSISETVATSSIAGVVATILGIGTAGSIVTLAVSGGFSGLIWLLIPIVLSCAVSVISALVTMAARQALIILLVMVSPIAIIAYLFPNTERWFDKWRKLLTGMLIFFPMFSVLYGGANLAGLVMISSAKNWLSVILGIAVMVIPLFMSIPLLKMSNSVLGKVDGFIRRLSHTPVTRASQIAGEQQALARSKQLAKNGRMRMPSTRLAQWMHRRQVHRDTDRKELDATNTETYTSEAYSSMRRKDGTFNRRGVNYYEYQRRRLAAKNAKTRFDLDMDEGLTADQLPTSGIAPLDQFRTNRLRKINDGYDEAIAEDQINTSRSKDVRLENLRRRADTIRDGVRDNDSEISKLIAKNFGYQHHTDAEVAAMSAHDRAAYERTTDHAINSVLSDAIAAKRKVDAEAKSDYIELFNDMPPGPDIQRNLVKSFQTKDYNAMTAAMEVMAKRGDYDNLTATLSANSHFIDGATDGVIQKHLAESLITMKKEDALLWSWAKAIMMRRAMNGAGKDIEAFVSLDNFLRETPLAGDRDADASLKVARTTILPNITDPGIGRSQDRTFWVSIQDAKKNGLITDANDLGLSIKQIRSAAVSGLIDGDTLAAINSLLVGGYDKIKSGRAKPADHAFFTANQVQIKQNVMRYISEMSAAQLVSSKSATINAINDLLIHLNPANTRVVNGVLVSNELYDNFENHRQALNKQSATTQRSSMNPAIRKMLGIDLN